MVAKKTVPLTNERHVLVGSYLMHVLCIQELCHFECTSQLVSLRPSPLSPYVCVKIVNDEARLHLISTMDDLESCVKESTQ